MEVITVKRGLHEQLDVQQPADFWPYSVLRIKHNLVKQVVVINNGGGVAELNAKLRPTY